MRESKQTRKRDGSKLGLREKEVRKFERKGRKDEWVRENNEGKHVLKPKNREAAVAQGTYQPRRK